MKSNLEITSRGDLQESNNALLICQLGNLNLERARLSEEKEGGNIRKINDENVTGNILYRNSRTASRYRFGGIS